MALRRREFDARHHEDPDGSTGFDRSRHVHDLVVIGERDDREPFGMRRRDDCLRRCCRVLDVVRRPETVNVQIAAVELGPTAHCRKCFGNHAPPFRLCRPRDKDIETGSGEVMIAASSFNHSCAPRFSTLRSTELVLMIVIRFARGDFLRWPPQRPDPDEVRHGRSHDPGRCAGAGVPAQ